MISGVGIRDRPLLGSTTHVPQEPPPRPDPPPSQAVQGVVVHPPRDSRVAVRVEIVTEPERPADREHDATMSSGTSSAPSPYEAYNDRSWFTVGAAELQPAAASVRFGAADARTAAAAYRAQADFQSATQAEPAREPPRHLSVRA